MMRLPCLPMLVAVASLAALPAFAQDDAGDADGGDDAGFVEPDAGFDAGPDPVLDAGYDAGPDPVLDAGYDAGPDPVPDAGPQPVDAGPDPLPDAGPQPEDAGPDPGPDAGPQPVDAGPDPVPDAGPPPQDAGLEPADAGALPAFDAGPPGGECTPRCIDERREGRCSTTGQLVPIVCSDDEVCEIDVCVSAGLAGTTGLVCSQGGSDTSIAFLALLLAGRLLRRRRARAPREGAPP